MHSFQVVMRGYDRRQVDELLARIDGTLGRGPATLPPVTANDVRCRTVRQEDARLRPQGSGRGPECRCGRACAVIILTLERYWRLHLAFGDGHHDDHPEAASCPGGQGHATAQSSQRYPPY